MPGARLRRMWLLMQAHARVRVDHLRARSPRCKHWLSGIMKHCAHPCSSRRTLCTYAMPREVGALHIDAAMKAAARSVARSREALISMSIESRGHEVLIHLQLVAHLRHLPRSEPSRMADQQLRTHQQAGVLPP